MTIKEFIKQNFGKLKGGHYYEMFLSAQQHRLEKELVQVFLDNDLLEYVDDFFNSKESRKINGDWLPHLGSSFTVKKLPIHTTLFNLDFKTLHIEFLENMSGNCLLGSECETLIIEECAGSMLPTQAIYNCDNLKYVWLPKGIKRIQADAFHNVSDDILIVTPYRERTMEKLRIPEAELDWYRQHLKFSHSENPPEVR